MKTFFVEQSKRNGILKKKIIQNQNKIVINANLKKMKVEKKEKIVKKIKEILIKEKCKQIVLEKELKNDKELVNLLYGYNINICSPKWLFKQLTNDIIEEVLKEKKKEESEISICVNNIDTISEKFILKFAKEFRNMKIITNHIEKFKKMEFFLFEKEGILISVNNNKKKSLSKSNLILNIDFPKELLNQFIIYDNANIISWEDDIKILKKRFNGKIIFECNYIFLEKNEVSVFIEENELKNYDVRDICQVLNNIPKGILEI